MKLIGLIRLGADVELRYTNDGTPVAELRAAWNHGRKGDDGKRPTQWASLSLWGDRAEKLAPYLLKGAQFLVHADDVHIETYQGRNGEGHKLVGRIDTLEFAGGDRQQQGQASAPAPAPRQQPTQQRQARPDRPPVQGGGSGFDDLEDDIPF